MCATQVRFSTCFPLYFLTKMLRLHQRYEVDAPCQASLAGHDSLPGAVPGENVCLGRGVMPVSLSKRGTVPLWMLPALAPPIQPHPRYLLLGPASLHSVCVVPSTGIIISLTGMFLKFLFTFPP